VIVGKIAAGAAAAGGLASKGIGIAALLPTWRD
jgi:hypothetical protein